MQCPWCGREVHTRQYDGTLHEHSVPGPGLYRARCRGSNRYVFDLDDPEDLLGLLAAGHRGGRWRDDLVPTAPDDDDPRVVERLRALHAQARELRGGHAADDPRRIASLALVGLLRRLRRQGYSYPRLDGLVGARPGTVRRRLARFGVLHLPPSQGAYRGARQEPA